MSNVRTEQSAPQLPINPTALLDYLYQQSRDRAAAHGLAAERWGGWRNLCGYPTAVVSALTGIAAFSELPYSKELTAAFAFVVAVLTASNTYFKPADRATQHERAQIDFRAIADEIHPFMPSIWEPDAAPSDAQEAKAHDQSLREWGARLKKRFDDLTSRTPVPPRWAEEQVRQDKQRRRSDLQTGT